MPYEQTDNGLVIETLDEIKTRLEVKFKDPDDGFGADADTRPNSPVGIIIGLMAGEIALIQQNHQHTQNEFTGDATGVNLDTISALTGTTRNGGRQSLSSSGNIIGTPGTTILDLSQVRNTVTQDVWEIVSGPYVIPPFGSVLCNLQALEDGDRTFEAATTWGILTSTPGWTGFKTTEDIDPEDIGQFIDTDAKLQQRRRDELFINGNDLAGIKARVSKVDNVTFVAVFENRDCANTVNGIPPGAIEVVVEGGANQDIIEAIQGNEGPGGAKPPGCIAFGRTFTGQVLDIEGNAIDVGLTRVTDIPILIEITVTTTGIEVPIPDNVEDLIKDSVLAFANSNLVDIGQDLQPSVLTGPVWGVLQAEETTKYAATNVVVKAAIDPGPVDTLLIPVDDISRLDFDSTRTTVVFV